MRLFSWLFCRASERRRIHHTTQASKMGNGNMNGRQVPLPKSAKVTIEGFLIKRSIRKGRSGGWQKRYYKLWDCGILDAHRKKRGKVSRRTVLSWRDQCAITWDPMITSEMEADAGESPPIFYLNNHADLNDIDSTQQIHLKAESTAVRDMWIKHIGALLKKKKKEEKQKKERGDAAEDEDEDPSA